MLIRNHEVFQLAGSPLTLWRYMNFTKLVSMLEQQALVFPRADLFDDPYEGLWSAAAVRQLRASQSELQIPPEQIDMFVRFPERFRKELYVSCWCANEHESAAMWKLFLSSSEGIAIRTTTELLGAAFDSSPLSIGLAPVKYIDYATTAIPMANVLFPVTHKRLSFAHEHEVRAVIWSGISDNEALIERDAKHVAVRVDVQTLLQAVHVSPTSPGWFGGLVEDVMRRYGLQTPVIRSSLYDRPTY